jgi:hypothetical protein
VYPEALTVNSSGVLKCSAKIGENSYSPTCTIDKLSRKIVFKRISTINLDFTQVTGGQLVELVMNGMFVNPQDEKPIDVSFKVNIKDKAGNIIAYFEA